MNKTVGKVEVEAPEGSPQTILTRTFDAPRDLVFKAHSSCEHMSKWWGLRGSSFLSCDLDFAEGGAWRIVVREADGSESPFKGEFKQIKAPELLTWTFCYDVAPYNEVVSVETMEFTEEDGRTTIRTVSTYPSLEVRDAVAGSGMADGAAETWDRLEEYVATLS